MEDSHSHSVSNGRSGTSSWWHTVKPFANGGTARVLQGLFYERPYHHPTKINLEKWSITALGGKEGEARVEDKRPWKADDSEEHRFWNTYEQTGVVDFTWRVPGGMILASLPYAVMFGSYETLRRKAISANGGMPLPFYQEVTCGILAATSASFVFVPRFEIEKLIVVDAALPAAQRVNYRSAGHAISCIVAKKGISALWRGQYRVTAGQRPPPISSIDCAFNMLKFGGRFKFFTGLSGYLFTWSPFLTTMLVMRDSLQEMEELIGW